MENLVGRKVLCTQSYDGVTRGKEYIITNVDNSGFYIIEDDDKKQRWCASHLHSKTNFELIIDEWQPKQGDKVLWSGVKSKDKRGIFICKFENYFIVKYIGDEYDLENGTLKYAEKIRPYEEEIKVGDWVKRVNDKTIWLIENKEDIDLAKRTDCKTITNIELIKLLNNEL